MAQSPQATLVTRLQYARLPKHIARQLPDLPSIIWVEPSSTGISRLRGALNEPGYDLSDRDIEEQCTWNLLFKSFLGLSAEELPPDHTVLCRFRQRLGTEGFQRLFNQVVEQARAQALVSDRLHIIDSTHMTAVSPETGAPRRR
jgi:hypothetical protein